MSRLSFLYCVLCAALRQLNELGSISLMSNEVLRVSCNSLFQGPLLEYHLSASETVFLRNETHCSLINAQSLDKPRKSGPVFPALQMTSFVLYTEDTIELWKSQDGQVTREWSLDIHEGAVQGVEMLGVGLFGTVLYWVKAEQYRFSYLSWDLFSEKPNLQAIKLTGIEHFDTMKVTVCSSKFIVAALCGSSGYDFLIKYQIDKETQQVTTVERINTKETSWGSPILSVICTNLLYVLASIGLFQENSKIQNNFGNLTSLSKSQSNNAFLHMTEGIINLEDIGSSLFIPNSTFFPIVLQDYTYYVGAQSQQQLSVIAISTGDHQITRAIIPIENPEVIKFIWLYDQSFLILNRAELLLYSISMSDPYLQIGPMQRNTAFTLCAIGIPSEQSLCLQSEVSILADPNAILRKKNFNLSEVVTPVLVSADIAHRVSQHNIPLFSLFSGENLSFSIRISELPEQIQIACEVDNQHYQRISNAKLALADPIVIKCACIHSAAFVSKDTIEVLEGNGKLYTIDISDWHLQPSFCVLLDQVLMVYSRSELRIEVAHLVLKWQTSYYVASNIQGAIGHDNSFICFSVSQVLEIKAGSRSIETLIETQGIVDIAVDYSSVWIVRVHDVLQVHWRSQRVQAFPLHSLLKLRSNSDLLVTYQTPKLLQTYFISSSGLVQGNAIKLNEDCDLEDFSVKSVTLFVVCAEYIQVINLYSQMHSAKLYHIPKYRLGLVESSRVSGHDSILVIECSAQICNITCYALFPIDSAGTLKVTVIDQSAFSQLRRASGLLSIASSSGHQLTTDIVFELANTGALIFVNSSWDSYVYSIPWSQSAHIDLTHLFAGKNITLACDLPDVQVRSQFHIAYRMQFPGLKQNQWSDVCDGVVTYLSDETSLILLRYSEGRVVLRSQVPLSIFNLSEVFHISILHCSNDSVLMLFRGSETRFRFDKSTTKIVDYHIGSNVWEIQLEYHTNQISFIHVVEMNLTELQVFSYDWILFRYIFLWKNGFKLSETTLIPYEFLKLTSIGSSIVNGEWRLYISDASLGLIEFAIHPQLTQLRILNIEGRIYSAQTGLIVIGEDQNLTIYSLPDFTAQKSVRFDRLLQWTRWISSDFPVSQRDLMATQVRVNEAVVFSAGVNSGFDQIANVYLHKFRLLNSSQGVGLDTNTGTVICMSFQSPSLEIFPDNNKAEGTHLAFLIRASNAEGEVHSKPFHIYRFSRAGTSWWMVGMILFAIGVAILACARLKRSRASISRSIELVSINSTQEVS